MTMASDLTSFDFGRRAATLTRLLRSDRALLCLRPPSLPLADLSTELRPAFSLVYDFQPTFFRSADLELSGSAPAVYRILSLHTDVLSISMTMLRSLIFCDTRFPSPINRTSRLPQPALCILSPSILATLSYFVSVSATSLSPFPSSSALHIDVANIALHSPPFSLRRSASPFFFPLAPVDPIALVFLPSSFPHLSLLIRPYVFFLLLPRCHSRAASTTDLARRAPARTRHDIQLQPRYS